MFDFRYHALSLVAVFLALMIGLLLGVAIGDQGLVSSAERNVRDSLRADVRRARAQADELRAEVGERRRLEEALYPLLVEGKLTGQRVGLIGMGGLPDSTIRSVREALEGTGARLAGVAVIGEPVPEDAAASLRGAADPPGARDFNRLGRATGVALARGGRAARELERGLLTSSSGRLGGLTGVVVFRAPREGGGEDAARTDAFEAGLVEGLADNDAKVVGAETTGTSPSQIPWFRDRRLSSIDNVDVLEGRAALVFVLAGANGSYGEKDTAQALVPNAAGATP
jgi:hypothetical protein